MSLWVVWWRLRQNCACLCFGAVVGLICGGFRVPGERICVKGDGDEGDCGKSKSTSQVRLGFFVDAGIRVYYRLSSLPVG